MAILVAQLRALPRHGGTLLSANFPVRLAQPCSLITSSVSLAKHPRHKRFRFCCSLLYKLQFIAPAFTARQEASTIHTRIMFCRLRAKVSGKTAASSPRSKEMDANTTSVSRPQGDRLFGS